MLAAIDFHALGQVIWVSAAAGVAVTVLYSLSIWGFDKSADARRSGQERAALSYGGLAVVALVMFAIVVVVGVTVLLKKG